MNTPLTDQGEAYVADLLRKEDGKNEDHAYNTYHAIRFDYVVDRCQAICPDPDIHVLDIGRSAISERLSKRFKTVTTLGFPLSTGADGRSADEAYAGHIIYDLNDAQTLKDIETDDRFDLVVFAEVIEHLYTAPELTLYVLKTVMKPGGLMMIQTPNAAALHKRIILTLGKNPYERIRINTQNPGHFREYTKKELIQVAQVAGFEVIDHEFKDYFGISKGRGGKLGAYLFKLASALVPSFSRGQTLVLRKPAAAPV